MQEEKIMDADHKMLSVQALLPSQVHKAGRQRVQQVNG
jgi:hypothetical protein